MTNNYYQKQRERLRKKYVKNIFLKKIKRKVEKSLEKGFKISLKRKRRKEKEKEKKRQCLVEMIKFFLNDKK